MPLTLYDATVPNFTQILGGLSGVLSKGEAHYTEKGMPLDEVVGARLFVDMRPLSFQVSQTAAHSIRAIEATQRGLFSPDMSPPPETYAALKAKVSDAIEALGKLTPADVDALEGKPMRFEVGERRMDFTAENFLMSFSMPNFYFHATTAYDILRHSGVPLGKRDYMGRPRFIG